MGRPAPPRSADHGFAGQYRHDDGGAKATGRTKDALQT